MIEMLHREFIYLWYYFDIQLRQIFPYWVLGMVLGSAISVFVKEKIHHAVCAMTSRKMGALGVVPASILGIASPLCMYGTIPLAAGFSAYGIPDDWLAAFMMSSILLNPQLMIYSAALGPAVLAVRVVSCFLCGAAAGLMVRFFIRNIGNAGFGFLKKAWEKEKNGKMTGAGRSGFKEGRFFDFEGFQERENRDTAPNLPLRFLKNLGRNIKATGPMFLLGVILSAVFQRYVPSDLVADLFGSNRGFGVLMAATIGVPLYACGGGTIPLLQAWLMDGMSMGSAEAFMVTGPATKITNLGALKIVLGARNFIFYLVYIMVFAFVTGAAVNLLI